MYCTMLLFYDYKNMNQEVEYKYVMSRNLVFNHALGSKGGDGNGNSLAFA
jgi:hypothetical protein